MNFLTILVSITVLFGSTELQPFKIQPAKIVVLPLPDSGVITQSKLAPVVMKKIFVTSKKYGTHYALIDDVDFDVVSHYSWSLYYSSRHHTFYAHAGIKRNGNVSTIRMHRLILGLVNSLNIPHVDHADGNGLNNQRINLRTCTPSENGGNQRICKINTSGYKGVNWVVANKKWQARITVRNNRIVLGSFSHILAAAKAYNNASIKYFGKFSKLNILPKWLD